MRHVTALEILNRGGVSNINIYIYIYTCIRIIVVTVVILSLRQIRIERIIKTSTLQHDMALLTFRWLWRSSECTHPPTIIPLYRRYDVPAYITQIPTPVQIRLRFSLPSHYRDNRSRLTGVTRAVSAIRPIFRYRRAFSRAWPSRQCNTRVCVYQTRISRVVENRETVRYVSFDNYVHCEYRSESTQF